ncbi:MAG: methylenetetrahydrofolate reductase [Thermostichales cyanobacterium SZTDM-1c_bins_54]
MNPISQLQAAHQRGEFLITAEVMPPKGGNPERMLQEAQGLVGRVHGVNVTDSSRAMARMSPLAAAVLLQQLGLEPVMQLACRDRNRIALQGDLLGAAALGIPNILALTGDPVAAGDCPGSRGVFDLESTRLLRLIGALNRGLDLNGKPLPDGPTRLFAGAAVDPQSPSRSGLERRFRRKLEAGAEFFQSQLISDFEQLQQFMDRWGYASGKPILAGIFLLKSAKNALYINKNVPGVQIPAAIIDRLSRAGDPLEEGIQIAAEQVQKAKGICQGVHLMAVRVEHLIPKILDYAGIPALLGSEKKRG